MPAPPAAIEGVRFTVSEHREVAGNRAVRLVIAGRVQGVWFRGWMVREAEARHLDGWVRNRRDGTVEALVSGPSVDVDGLIQACWNGPRMARVDDIVVEAAEPPGTSGFLQVPSA